MIRKLIEPKTHKKLRRSEIREENWQKAVVCWNDVTYLKAMVLVFRAAFAQT